MRTTEKTNIKATRTQLERMKKQVLIHMIVSGAGMLLLLALYVFTLDAMGVFSAMESVGWAAFGLINALVFGAMFLFVASFPALYILFHLLPKYRRIDAALYPEDYTKWMRLSRADTNKLPKDDVKTAYRIYKEFRPRLPYGREELEALLKKELKREWYRRLTIAMLCGLLLNCPDFTDTKLLRRAMTERKDAAQFIFPVWLDCMEGRTVHVREIIAAQFLTHWDKKLYKGW